MHPMVRKVGRGVYNRMPKFRAQRYRLSTWVRAKGGHRFGLLGTRPLIDLKTQERTLVDPRRGATVTTLDFQCNVCGTEVKSWPLAALDRDTPCCPGCGSSVRMRSVVHLLSLAIFGKSLVLPDWPKRKDVQGLGLSDWSGYGRWLHLKTGYLNTYFHTEPRLDICNAPESRKGTLDFLISTEVFEHVPPPASRAFEGAAMMLKEGGVLIFTVPFSNDEKTVEHFPNLFDFEIVERAGRHVLLNTTKDGKREEFSDLVFHGGPGTTLEMRLFSRSGLIRELQNAGFADIQVFEAPVLEYGIVHWHPWSLPIVARKGRRR